MSDDLVKMCRRLSKYAHAQLSASDLERIADRIEELEAKVQSLTALLDNQLGTPCEQVRHQEQVEALEAKLAKAVEALEECVEEIDAYIQHQYPHDHPVQERDRQQDYASNPARLALAELTGGKDE